MKTVALLAVFSMAALAVSAAAPGVAAEGAVPTTMLAAAFDHPGGPEVLTIHRLAVPKPKDDEVLIAVQTAGVGAWEVGLRRHPSPDTKFPVVLGSDGAGTIAAVGSSVIPSRPGGADVWRPSHRRM
jgi:NADPH:quinone reductase-like Zn-dependent oxidoreductase